MDVLCPPRPEVRISCSAPIGEACRFEASGPHLMMKGAKATGLRCVQCSHPSAAAQLLRHSDFLKGGINSFAASMYSPGAISG
jgi:hypothetical protein